MSCRDGEHRVWLMDRKWFVNNICIFFLFCCDDGACDSREFLWNHVIERLSRPLPDDGASGLSESCQRTLSITALHSVHYFCSSIILIRLSHSALWVRQGFVGKSAEVSKQTTTERNRERWKRERIWIESQRETGQREIEGRCIKVCPPCSVLMA